MLLDTWGGLLEESEDEDIEVKLFKLTVLSDKTNHGTTSLRDVPDFASFPASRRLIQYAMKDM